MLNLFYLEVYLISMYKNKLFKAWFLLQILNIKIHLSIEIILCIIEKQLYSSLIDSSLFKQFIFRIYFVHGSNGKLGFAANH